MWEGGAGRGGVGGGGGLSTWGVVLFTSRTVVEEDIKCKTPFSLFFPFFPNLQSLRSFN